MAGVPLSSRGRICRRTTPLGRSGLLCPWRRCFETLAVTSGGSTASRGTPGRHGGHAQALPLLRRASQGRSFLLCKVKTVPRQQACVRILQGAAFYLSELRRDEMPWQPVDSSGQSVGFQWPGLRPRRLCFRIGCLVEAGAQQHLSCLVIKIK